MSKRLPKCVTAVCGSSNAAVFRRFTSGKILFYPIARTSGYDEIFKITEDSDGRVWIAHTRGIFIIQPETSAPPANTETRQLTVKEQTVSADFVLPQISSGTILRLAFSEISASPQEELITIFSPPRTQKPGFPDRDFCIPHLPDGCGAAAIRQFCRDIFKILPKIWRAIYGSLQTAAHCVWRGRVSPLSAGMKDSEIREFYQCIKIRTGRFS